MLAIVFWLATTAAAVDDPVIAQVRAADDALQAAHGRGDLATYRAGLSKHYAYVDVGGARVTGELLQERRENDLRRVVSSETSEDEAVRLADNAVMLRGVDTSLATYYGGLPRASVSRWTALWVREDDGVWRLAAETATPVRQNDGLAFVPAPQPAAVLQALAGNWRVATETPLTLQLRVEGETLVGSLAGQDVRWTFHPASPTHFFAKKRPFELRVAADGQSLQFVTWGTATEAKRVITPASAGQHTE